ncbi:MAG: histidinol-phosphatase HisJ family protein [Chloroflexi bacterium]|nr:histidinol-phosphatase HisJ family protein [Chloroflexota bacterium]
MMIQTDLHLHSSFSTDSVASMKSMIEKAIKTGLKWITFTEHQDFDYPSALGVELFQLDKVAYREHFETMREQYQDKIELLFGVEVGLEPRHAERINAFLGGEPFDLVIGSSHLVQGKDPHNPGYFDELSDEEGYEAYFRTLVDNTAAIKTYDVYGHLDYVVRYGRTRDERYNPMDYRDIFETALRRIIADGKGVEINMAGIARGLKFPNPHPELIKLYRQLGGEIITIGSDAHTSRRIGLNFELAREILIEAGFKYYAYYKQRQPVFLTL